MKTLQFPLGVLLGFLSAATAHAQLSLQAASLKPAGFYSPANTTNILRLEDCRIDPLSAPAQPATNRFQLSATLNRIYTAPQDPGLKLRISTYGAYPFGFMRVDWMEDEISCGYALQATTNLASPAWTTVPAQASGNSRRLEAPSIEVLTKQAEFYRLNKQ